MFPINGQCSCRMPIQNITKCNFIWTKRFVSSPVFFRVLLFWFPRESNFDFDWKPNWELQVRTKKKRASFILFFLLKHFQMLHITSNGVQMKKKKSWEMRLFAGEETKEWKWRRSRSRNWWIQRKSPNKVLSRKWMHITRRKKGPSYVRTRTSYTWHPHTQLFMSNWKQSHTKYECCARGDIFSAIAEFCVFFSSCLSPFFWAEEEMWKKGNKWNVLFSNFSRVFQQKPIFFFSSHNKCHFSMHGIAQNNHRQHTNAKWDDQRGRNTQHKRFWPASLSSNKS